MQRDQLQAATETLTDTEKVVFASHEWLVLARKVLEELVVEHGEAGASFSVCEAFTDAPEGVAGPQGATAAWHFRIVDKSVTVGAGEIEGADMFLRVPYRRAVRGARFVYPGFVRFLVWPLGLIARLRGRPSPPPYLMELHNRLARVTQ